MNLKRMIRVIPDFPQAGISFKDITTVLKDPDGLRFSVQEMARHFRNRGVDLIVGVESRGFLIGAPLAYEMGTGFVLVRKPGKLPAESLRVEYEKEYGTDALEIHRDAVEPGQRILLVDDLLATGGTIGAAAQLVEQLGGEIVGFAFMVELAGLNGRERLGDREVFTLVRYNEG